jgi:iron complex outermembrane recepter protein
MGHLNRHRLAKLIRALAHSAAACSAAFGVLATQSTPAMAAGATDSAVLEEVVVTARKREEDLQKVPVSITAYTPEMLERTGAVGFQDIMLRTPNLYEAYLGEAKGSPPIIRGVQGTNTAGADPAVGFVVDDVFYGNNTAAVFDYFDLASVEVLRGPQGTLFGRNTTGGVINVHTRDPGDSFEGSLAATAGNYDYTRFEGAAGGPLVAGVLGARVAAVFNNRDGFIKNTYPGGKDLRSEHNWSTHGVLHFTPRDSTTLDLRIDYRDTDQRGGGTKGDGDNLFFSGVIPGTENLEFHFNDPFAYSVDWDQSGRETLQAWGTSLTFAERFANSELRSITAYRTHKYFSIFDTDFSPNHWINDGSPEEYRQVSQEIRWSSTSDGPLSWIAGLYYFHGNSLDLNFITFQQDILGFLGAPPGTPDLKTQAHGRQLSDSYAAYGHLNWALGERASVAVGVRLSHDRKSIDYVQEDPSGFFGGGFALTDSDSWTKPTGDVTFSYQWTDARMSYASVARGYKAGGFNDGIGQADNPPFAPEYVTSYEVGWKSTGLGGRLRFNIDAFYLDWTDIQVAGFDTSDPNNVRRVTGNFASAHSTGIEFELTARPVDALELSLNGGRLRGGFAPDANAGIAGTDSLTGPEYSLAASVLYTQSLGASGTLQWYLDAQRQGPNDLIKGPAAAGEVIGPHQDPFNIVNARIAYQSPARGWTVALWGKNLGNEVYRSKYFQIGSPLLPPGALTLSEPRTYGAEVQFAF